MSTLRLINYAVPGSVSHFSKTIIDKRPWVKFLDGYVLFTSTPITETEVLNKKTQFDNEKNNVRKNDAIASIKTEASRRIIAMAPEWQQRNMLARAAELLEIIAFGSTLTIVEEKEHQGLIKGRAAIKGVRDKSNTLETSVASMTGAELAAFDPTLDTHWA